MKKLMDLLLYGGVTREQYKSIRSDISDSNRISLMDFATIAFLGMGILFLLSSFMPVFASSRISYLVIIFLSACIYAFARWPGKKHDFIIHLCVYLFELALLAFGIILGTLVEPNQASASFGILLFTVPLLFIDVPLMTGTELVLSIVIYYFVAQRTQTSEMLSFNLSVILPYGVVAILLCSIIMRVKVSRLVLNHANKNLSEKDQLTGLFNRRSFEMDLIELKNNPSKASFLIFEFDINGLKEANDTKGHAAGDEIITAFSSLVLEIFGPYGKCYRTGGDEFYAIVSGDGLDVDDLILELQFKCNEYNANHSVTLSFAAGASQISKDSDIEAVIKETDRLMYESKQMYYFNKNNNAQRPIDWDSRISYETNFESAIQNKEFKVYCQPKYNAISGIMTSAEALVRWIKPDGTILMPGEFIPVYENNHQIITLDKYMFTSVCEIQKNFLNEGITPFPISVNISRVTLFSLGIIDTLCRIIDTFELPKNLVPIEITESAALDSVYFTDIVKELKAAGFYLHMDDFGHGYSSLNNLRLLPFDVVKLDKSLVDDIGNDTCDETLKHLIELSHFLKMEVVAEGVENEAQHNFLKKITCDTIQGYAFSRPINLDEYTIRVRESINSQPLSIENIRKMSDEASIGSLKITNDLKLRYLRAMSSIYMTMHVINLIDNTTTEFATTTNVKEHASMAHNADVQMKAVMQNVVSPEYVERVLDFVDFTTLPARMKGKRTISMDFVGVHFGWTRGRFITVETNDYDEPTTVIFTTQVIEADHIKDDNSTDICITDELTGVFNKEAYYRDSNKANSRECLVGDDPDLLIVSYYKVNDREKIVATGGQSSWDDVVVGAAIMINSGFANTGRTYRISDDTFIVLSYGDSASFREILDDIDKKAADWLSENVRGFSISHGSASKMEFPAYTIDSLRDVAKARSIVTR